MFVCVALLGYKRFELQNIVEDHLKLLIVRNFDPKKADLIFTEEGSVGARTLQHTTPKLVFHVDHYTLHTCTHTLVHT